MHTIPGCAEPSIITHSQSNLKWVNELRGDKIVPLQATQAMSMLHNSHNAPVFESIEWRCALHFRVSNTSYPYLWPKLTETNTQIVKWKNCFSIIAPPTSKRHHFPCVWKILLITPSLKWRIFSLKRCTYPVSLTWYGTDWYFVEIGNPYQIMNLPLLQQLGQLWMCQAIWPYNPIK